jgi:NAD(P)-dependent dehydrogenase (short-subunit alcohol dehydrogenase family)
LISDTGTPRIINVSSGAGSVAIRLNPKWDHPMLGRNIQYRASKAAENMISAGIWREVEPLGKLASSPQGWVEVHG